MNNFKFSLAACIPAFLLFSCGTTPGGKFKDGDSATAQGIDTTTKYFDFPGATKWDDSWSKENVVVYHWKSEPGGLHPTNNLDAGPTRMVFEYLHRFFVSTDIERLTARPDLLKRMPEPSADGLTWTYELRDEPTWDDGSQLSVDDVIFTLMAWECPYTDDAYARSSIDNVKEIKRDPSNPRKFILVMRQNTIQNEIFLGDVTVMQRKFHDPENVLAKYTLAQFMDDPKFKSTPHPDLEKWAKEFNDPKYGRSPDKINGLGAYKLESWEDMNIVLVKKQNHWTSKLKDPDLYNVAYPEKIIFKVNTDDNAIALELHQQAIDASTWVSTRTLDELSRDSTFTKNYNYAFVPNFDYQFMAMNMKPAAVNRPPFFTDVRVRRAIALLTPVDELNKNYMLGKSTRMVSLVSPNRTNAFDNTLKPIPYDIEKAKQLLDEAGWKDTDGDNIRDKMIDGKKVQFSCEILIASGPVYEHIAADVANAMYPAGIKANVRTLEFGAMNEAVKAHQFDLYLGAWQQSFLAEDYKQIWHSTSYSNGGSNYAGYGNPAADALIDSIRIAIDPVKRVALEKRLQKIVYDDQPYVFLFSSVRKVVIHKRFDNGDIYYEKPGVHLSSLRAMSPGKMAKMTTIN